MRTLYSLIAPIVFVAFMACAGQAGAQTIMCPDTVRLDVSPAVAGWTSNAAREGRLADVRVSDGQLVCSYDDNATTFTLTRPVLTGLTCRVIAGGFQCDPRRLPVIVAPPTIARLPSAPALPTCDLVVSSITLTKLDAPGAVRVAYQITNRGNRVWSAGAGGATATLVVADANGRSSRNTQRLPERVEPGAVVATSSVDLRDDPFDVFPYATDFSGGTVDVTISAAGASFAACSDLTPANNAFQLSFADTAGFMGGTLRTRTWSQ